MATPDSDYDYRGVYVNSTADILNPFHTYKGSHWVEGEKEDQTAYELGHFLKLAIKCNPAVLEVMRGPIVEANEDGEALRRLFPHIWNPKDTFNAFVGYSTNQRKKMLDKKDDRGPKFACAYLRTLYNLVQLLDKGIFSLEVQDPFLKNKLIQIRNGNYKPGQVIDIAEDFIERAKVLRDNCTQVPDLDKVNETYLEIRKKYWRLPDE